MQVVQGKRLVTPDGEVLDTLRAGADRVVVDVGTGDARTAYRLARAQPDWLVVGVDPAWQRMTPTSVRAARKPAKGGTPNLLLVNAAIETVPADLYEIADEVLVLMPWGKLLRGVVHGEADVCAGLRRVARAGATLEITVGTSIWRDPVPLEIRELPELTPEYVDTVLADRLAGYGWQVTGAEVVSGAEMDRISSSWARRLGSANPEVVIHVRASAVDPR
ncbi:16S rRNA (adenine(1408)-N(1))-methyltransferase [Micromonospora pisi]|uniref:16S rRNA (Adenine(1408)-N(1))-methyltransferase n=1 Tax=Micromonospora pisi TaxID=589240 RepID=A0A495JLW1_9ACTN|nr:class I SAM-dependent methyltransferase [Micromonospora pisi]RKR89903.1 16S rRNA (adenine(1408)-N(1))-methyltransferase [Micromonospora pisi]